MFHKFQSQINVPFLADSRKKITRGACQAAKAVNMGVKIGLADSNRKKYYFCKKERKKRDYGSHHFRYEPTCEPAPTCSQSVIPFVGLAD
jgi:hypothetical protein